MVLPSCGSGMRRSPDGPSVMRVGDEEVSSNSIPMVLPSCGSGMRSRLSRLLPDFEHVFSCRVGDVV
ncbi:hypothetical protein LSAT2_018373 [Lamellibrachia satsuma]|nr:hypothetical protein LSAT2_018373 [Lamellibrachia satsuma]